VGRFPAFFSPGADLQNNILQGHTWISAFNRDIIELLFIGGQTWDTAFFLGQTLYTVFFEGHTCSRILFRDRLPAFFY